MSFNYFLETKRTYIRAFEDKDFSSIKSMMLDHEVMKFTGFRKVQTIEKIAEYFDKWKLEGNSHFGVWCVEEKASDECIAWFMLKETGEDFPELGFMLRRDRWGEGFATEVAKCLLGYAFNELACIKVMAKSDSINRSSIAVLEKIGMKKIQKEVDKTLKNEVFYFEISNDC